VLTLETTELFAKARSRQATGNVESALSVITACKIQKRNRRHTDLVSSCSIGQASATAADDADGADANPALRFG
jgi:hypothetical protein